MVQRPLRGQHDFIKVERLRDEIIRAKTNSLDCAVTRTECRNNNHGDRCQAWVSSEVLKEIFASHLRHFPITEYEVRSYVAKKTNGHRTVVRLKDRITPRAKNFGKSLSQVGFVVDDENYDTHLVRQSSSSYYVWTTGIVIFTLVPWPSSLFR